MKRHRIFLAVLILETIVLVALFLDSRMTIDEYECVLMPANRELVAGLSLTDLALGTEARYTRHPSQADFFAPFQDFPSAIEHYPAGSVYGPRSGTANRP